MRRETSAPPVILTDDQEKYPLGRHLEILEDVEKNLTIADVATSETAPPFVPSQTDVPNFGLASSTYWVRLTIHNQSREIEHWQLEISQPNLNWIDLYLPSADEQGFEVRQTGNRRPFSWRDFDHRHFVFNLSLAPQGQQTIYLRFENEGPINLPLTLWTPTAFAQKNQTEQLVLGLFYGALLIALGFNLFIFWLLREKSYLYFVFVIASYLLGQVSGDGLAAQYLWPNLTWWNPIAGLFFGGFVVIAMLKFTGSILVFSGRASKMRPFMSVLMGLSGVLIFLTLFAPQGLVLPVYLILFLLTILTMLAVGIISWRQGYRPARYFVMAWLTPVGAGVVFVLVRLGIVPSHLLTEESPRVGVVLLILFLSLVLADRFVDMSEKAQKDMVQNQREALRLKDELNATLKKMNEELEQRVEVRTHELTQSNQQLHLEVSERKQMEKALRQSEQKLLFHVQHTPLAYIEWDVDQHIQNWNPAAEQIFGYSKADAVSLPIFSLIMPAEMRPYLRELWQVALSQLSDAYHTYENVTKDGRTIVCEWYNTPLKDEQGRIIGLASLVQDVTERKRAEEALVEAKEAAETANQAKSDFLSNMSHELRTPLNGILGYTQILKRDGNLTERQYNGLEIIQHSGEHLLTLINDILDLSKIEAHRMELYLTEFHFPDFLRGITNIMRLRAEERGIDFVADIPDSLPIGIQADEKRLRQVLINLLGNAVKFTHEGKVTFRIIPLANGKYRFEVSDTGIGISEAQLEKIFFPFEQAGTPELQAEGTGLGLAISQKLVQAMGGELQVSSALAVGSTFWFDIMLPVVTVAAHESGQVIKRAIVGYRGRPLTILIVDDKAYNRSMLVNLLQPLGFKLVEAVNGHHAIGVARKVHPDLIIMDLIMPELSGLEATRTLRQIPALNDCAIIAVSASAYARDEELSLEVGCDGFIAKPFDVEELLELLRRTLDIEWVYRMVMADEETNDINGQLPPYLPVADYIVPPQPEMEILLDLAMRGNMRGIRERAHQISQMDAQFQPFATRLKQLADAFEEQAILALIKQHI